MLLLLVLLLLFVIVVVVACLFVCLFVVVVLFDCLSVAFVVVVVMAAYSGGSRFSVCYGCSRWAGLLLLKEAIPYPCYLLVTLP